MALVQPLGIPADGGFSSAPMSLPPDGPGSSRCDSVHHAHAALAQFLDDPTVRDRCSDHNVPLPLSLRFSGILKVATTRGEAFVGDFGTSSNFWMIVLRFTLISPAMPEISGCS